jgi:hypothetical protein
MNWASYEWGATISSFSSQVEGCEASNLLISDSASIWLSQQNLPQWICVSQ